MSAAPTQSGPEAARPAASEPRWRTRLRRDRTLHVALLCLVLLTLAVTAGPLLSPYGEAEQNLARANAGPSWHNWMGCDGLGRCLLTRLLYGGRVSLLVGLAGAAISLGIGVVVGGIAGLSGGWVESLILRLIDILYGVPLLLVVIALMVLSGPGLGNVFLALGLVYWLEMARVVRARVAELRSRDFVAAARALGASPVRIFLTHILPNAANVIVVTATFLIPQAIFTESFLSFLGLGVTVPHASWGTLASEGLGAMRSYPHQLFFPAAMICLAMWLFQVLGERLRAALDPRDTD